MTSPIQTALVGCGGFAKYHLARLFKQQETTQIAVLCDPNPAAVAAAVALFKEAGLKPPPTRASLEAALTDFGSALDAALIVTPHAFHHDQTVACLETGLDVLLEKPMAMSAAEARSLIQTRDRTGRLLVVAFPGSLSPEIRTAARILHSGELGELLNIHAVVWQNWKDFAAGTWRATPSLSGGGFAFDTGAHLLNTVADLAGEPFAEVTAWFDQRDTPVDILAVASGRLQSGALVSLSFCGDTIPSCHSDVRFFCREGILQTGVWGDYLNIQRRGEAALKPVDCPPSLGVWQQFLAVRAGQLPNPCPPEVGLRMAQLWDALQASARQGGQPVAGQ